MIVRAAPPEHYHWLSERAGVRRTSDFRAIEAVDAEGHIHGMVGYDFWTPAAVWMHVALEPAGRRPILQVAFRYPFVQNGKLVVLAGVSGANHAMNELARSLGFSEIDHIPDGWVPGVTLNLYSMHRRDCRWIGG